jgi:hypothetical protein
MLKRLFELLGLATMGVGLWLVIANEGQNTSCNALQKYEETGVSAECSRIVYSYFSGFVLLALGVMVVIFGLLSTRKSKKRRLKTKTSVASTYVWKNPATGQGPIAGPGVNESVRRRE